MKFTLAFALAALSSTALAITGFTGCSDCAGFDHDDVFNSCTSVCLQDEQVEQAVKQGCVARCHTYVLDKGCCPAGICLGKGQVRRSYPPMVEVVPNVVDELSDGVSDVGVLEKGVEVDSGLSELELDERGLEKRDFAGCCAACTALAIASNRCPNSRLSMGLNMAS